VKLRCLLLGHVWATLRRMGGMPAEQQCLECGRCWAVGPWPPPPPPPPRPILTPAQLAEGWEVREQGGMLVKTFDLRKVKP